MNVLAAAQEMNRRSAQDRSYHFCDPTLTFSDPLYEKLLAPWRAKRGNRSMPSRRDISPRDLKDILRNIVVFERNAIHPSSYVFRLIGTGLTAVAGDVTGKTFSEAVQPNLLSRWIECCDLILDGGQPLRFIGRVHINGREYLDAEHLYVPLANDNDVPTFIMGLCRYTPRQTDDEESWENQIASLPGGLL